MDQKKILIIDDEQDLIEVLAGRLTRMGFEAEGHTDPVEGRRAAIRTRPDLIILDVRIPGWSGLELIESLTHLPETRGTPVLIYTAVKDPVVDLEARALGAVETFVKAVDDRALLDKVKELLS